MSTEKLLTFPDAAAMTLSIRAKALLFHDARSVSLLQDIERVAQSEATVLVVGETGTGKELVARHIHKCSGRSGPFLAVNCGAFSETLIDAELFGHEVGAFTGAGQARAGWFEAANGGTLFLDEIGDLPLALQVKLLRVLQERQVVRLGSRRPIPLDVRLVAATNVDLRRAVEAQHFRADLYYRLSVAALELPPLRGRRGDILPLARHFMSVYAGKLAFGSSREKGVTLSPEAESALLAYAWPGNIRELENVIHYALIVCKDGVVRASDFRFSPLVPLVAGLAPGEPVVAPPADTRPSGPYDALAQALQALLEQRPAGIFQTVESLLVRRAYAQCRDNQVQAAKLLGVTRNTLRTLLKRHGLLRDNQGDDDPRAGTHGPARDPVGSAATAATH
ncbi:sigma-54-dependent Fis family transcriptional regulator [Piscinibacter sp. HJYY11]|uniref:sigma-54 interaction domain-containing protein n=1 Tax=Piscinibacter sp. HJYY11 TaxID=2801333 RepID=UPI00192025B9|nr:sigma-54 dependent transcriptional regulator [Piscinibacter sp. HJYY11]MBL0728569.1 sigma-54-dependent Fis family transcriptional regulator [Piscinibacter sp. HJYY11]